MIAISMWYGCRELSRGTEARRDQSLEVGHFDVCQLFFEIENGQRRVSASRGVARAQRYLTTPSIPMDDEHESTERE